MGVFVVNVTAVLCSILLNIDVIVEAKLKIEKEQLELQKLEASSA